MGELTESFLAYQARVVRSVVVDCARRRRAEERGGDPDQVGFEAARRDFDQPRLLLAAALG